jgi:hypothetical protein
MCDDGGRYHRLPLVERRMVYPAIKWRVVLNRGNRESVAWLRERHVEALIKPKRVSPLSIDP